MPYAKIRPCPHELRARGSHTPHGFSAVTPHPLRTPLNLGDSYCLSGPPCTRPAAWVPGAWLLPWPHFAVGMFLAGAATPLIPAKTAPQMGHLSSVHYKVGLLGIMCCVIKPAHAQLSAGWCMGVISCMCFLALVEKNPRKSPKPHTNNPISTETGPLGAIFS